MADFTNRTDKEIKEIIKAFNKGMKNFNDTLEAFKGINEEIYGKRVVTDKMINYMNAISKKEINLEQAMKDYRNYLQDKKTLEGEIMKSLGLPEYIEIKDGAERWMLSYSEIIDENDERKMVIEYRLER